MTLEASADTAGSPAPHTNSEPHTTAAAATGSGDLRAPLYVAWQITNECNLACLHCIEESGPGKAFRDELSDAQVFAVLSSSWTARCLICRSRAANPWCTPRFFDMVAIRLRAPRPAQDRNQRPLLDPENCERLAQLGVKAVQVSLDGASRETFNRMRVRGDFDTRSGGHPQTSTRPAWRSRSTIPRQLQHA